MEYVQSEGIIILRKYGNRINIILLDCISARHHLSLQIQHNFLFVSSRIKKMLRVYGVGGKLLKAVQSFYVDSRACVRVGNNVSE